MRILSIFVFVPFFVVFCVYLLLGAFLKAGINEFEISIKFCVFDTHNDIFQEKNFLGHTSTHFLHTLYANAKKTVHFLTFCIIGNIYQSSHDSYWNSKTSIKLKPPTTHRVDCASAHCAYGSKLLAHTAHVVAKSCKIVLFASVCCACGSTLLAHTALTVANC